MELFPKDPGKVLIKVAYISMIFAAVFFLLPIVFSYALPFVFAYIIAKIISPIADFMHKHLKFPKKMSIIIALLLLLTVVGWLIYTLVYQAIYEVQRLAFALPTMFENNNTFSEWGVKFQSFCDSLPPFFQGFISNSTENISGNLSSYLEPATTALMSFATKFAASIPGGIIAVVITLLSSYFICSEKDKIRKFFEERIPEKYLVRARFLKSDLYKACGGYIKAQLILMCITFVVLLGGFIILGVNSSVLVAFVVAVVDAIPVLGTGTILIPWALVSLFMGKYFLALGLTIVYLLTFFIRRFTEPKIISHQIGLNPLLTLIAVYVGYRAIGVFGMILGPILTIIIINFFQSEQRYDEQFEKAEE